MNHPVLFVVGHLQTHTSGARGFAALPHAPFWTEVAGLVSDGLQYVKGGGSGTGRRRPLLKGSGISTDGGGGRKSKSKKEKKENKKKAAVEADTKRADVVRVVEADGGLEAGVVGLAGTAAGGGGRWVHEAA